MENKTLLEKKEKEIQKLKQDLKIMKEENNSIKAKLKDFEDKSTKFLNISKLS